MIEIIEGLPDNVLGIIVKGRLTKTDCAEILLPKLRKALDWHYKLRLYYEIRSRFPGAAWETIDLGLDHVPWERVAIVTDVASVRHTVQALRLVIPGDIRVFEFEPDGAGARLDHGPRRAGAGRGHVTRPPAPARCVAADRRRTCRQPVLPPGIAIPQRPRRPQMNRTKRRCFAAPPDRDRPAAVETGARGARHPVDGEGMPRRRLGSDRTKNRAPGPKHQALPPSGNVTSRLSIGGGECPDNASASPR